MAKNKNVIKYKNPINFNIGLIIFLIIIIYVLFNVFSYFTKNDIAEYQVQQGSIASNNVYQGIILRDETIEYAKKSGYVDYFMKSGSKVSVTDIVYSIDVVGNISNQIAAEAKTSSDISEDSITSIAKEIDIFLKNYDANKFKSTYSFLNSLSSEITYTNNSNALNDMSEKINQAQANNTFFPFTASQDGIIVYEMDGYENASIDDITESLFDYSSYSKTYFTSNKQVTTSDPVFKRINSEDWYVILPINEKLAKELNEKTSVNIRFCKDDFTTNASCSIIRENASYYLKLHLRTGMIRYIEDRFIDVELVMKATSGLKIPVSAITTKEFFTVPKEYFTQENRELLVREIIDGTEVTKLTSPTIYYETEDYYYIDNDNVSAGDIVLKPDSSLTYIIGTDTDSLIGVYNINKGYAIFKQINILYENEDYAIIETKTAYGISLYDHIALDASAIKENQLITK